MLVSQMLLQMPAVSELGMVGEVEVRHFLGHGFLSFSTCVTESKGATVLCLNIVSGFVHESRRSL